MFDPHHAAVFDAELENFEPLDSVCFDAWPFCLLDFCLMTAAVDASELKVVLRNVNCASRVSSLPAACVYKVWRGSCLRANSSEEELREVLVAAATLRISQEDDGRTLSVSMGSLHPSALLLFTSLFPSPSPSVLLSFPAGLAGSVALRRFGPRPCPVSAAALHFAYLYLCALKVSQASRGRLQ